MEQLTHKITLFVPSTYEGNKPAKRLQKKVARKAASRFSVLFGGATATNAVGFWMSKEKGLIPEKQILISSNCTASDKAAKLENVLSFAKAICKYMKQEAVSVEIDNVLQFVEA